MDLYKHIFFNESIPLKVRIKSKIPKREFTFISQQKDCLLDGESYTFGAFKRFFDKEKETRTIGKSGVSSNF